MVQPPGFKNSSHPTYVCKLKKSLCGLKQAPRAWFKRFTAHLDTLGFEASLTDSSLFVQDVDGFYTYLLLYVDDIIIADSDMAYISMLKLPPGVEFQITDLGLLRYFLGLEISHCDGGLLVSQAKYLTDLLFVRKWFVVS